MTQTDLIELIQRARAGDPQAQEELIADIQNRVYYHCKKMLKNESDAQDAAQDVLITVLTSLDKLREPAAFYGWVNGITANRCKHLLSQGKDAQFLENEDGSTIADDLEDLDVQAVPEAVLDDHETQRLMMEIIDALPPDQRMSVLFYYYDEMSVRDIAQAMEVSEGTVKSRLNYARKSIKAGVEDLEKRGTKLYGLAPLPLLLFLLRREAAAFALGADQSAQLTAGVLSAARAQMAAAGAGAAGTSAASGAAAAKTGLTLGAKILLGLAAAALAGGAVFAGAKLLSQPEEPPAAADRPSAAIQPEEDEPAPTETPEPEPEGPSEELLALLDSIVYYGDPQQCTLDGNQAQAFAQVISQKRSEWQFEAFSRGYAPAMGYYAALFDVGDGTPALFLGGGPIADWGEPVEGEVEWSGEGPGYSGVWEYRDGAAVENTVGNCLVQRDGGMYLISLSYPIIGTVVGDVYALTGSAIPGSPTAAGAFTSEGGSYRYTIDGAEVSEAEYQAWAEQWAGEILCGAVHYGGGLDGAFLGLGNASVLSRALEEYAASVPAPQMSVQPGVSYEEAYAQLVQDPPRSEMTRSVTDENITFDLIYLDGDDTPELVICFYCGDHERVDLYTFTPEGELRALCRDLTVGKWGKGLYYFPRESAVLGLSYIVSYNEPEVPVYHYYQLNGASGQLEELDSEPAVTGEEVRLTGAMTAEEMLARLGQ